MANGNGNNGPQGPGRNVFGPPPATDTAPVNPDPNQPPVEQVPPPPAVAVGGWKKVWHDHHIIIIGGLLILILLMLLALIGGLVWGSHKSNEKVAQATVELNQAKVGFVQAVSDATKKNEGERTINLQTMQSEEGGIKAFIVSVFKTLCDEQQLFCNNAPVAPAPKVSVSLPTNLIKKIVEEARAGENEALAAKDQHIASLGTDISQLRADKLKLEVRLSQQPAPQLYDPADAESAAALARIEANQQTLQENQAALAQEQRSIVSRIELSNTKIQQIVSEKLSSKEAEEARAKASHCPAGESIPILMSEEPIKWFLVLNPSDLKVVQDATEAKRNEAEDNFTSSDSLPLANDFLLHDCINVKEYYLSVGQGFDQRYIRNGALEHKVVVIFPFVPPDEKGNYLTDTFAPGKDDIVEKVPGHPMLKGG